MKLKRKSLSAVAVTAIIALIMSACGGGGQGSEDEGTPRKGGTLRYVGSEDVDHLDTASAYYVVSSTLMRTFTRQLFTYPAKENPKQAIEPIPDIATEIPTTANGGITENDTKYTIRLREGVMWDTKPARPVVARDFVRGLKRLCNPVQPAGGLTYYTGTIVGMQEFCDGFNEVEPKVAPMKEYVRNNDIEGLSAPDDRTLEIKLKAPATDFINIMAMGFASPAPVEYLDYIPDSAKFRQNTISNGPYKITEYVPDKSYRLERNPSWQASSDPVRKAHVNAIEVRMGQDAEDAVQQQLEAGTADLSWDLPVPTQAIPRLMQEQDPNFHAYDLLNSNPFLVFNHQSPNEDRAVQKLKVRQAISYAINKIAIAKIYGGIELNPTLNQVIPPGNVGHKKFNLYPTPNDSGDQGKCRQLLREAGYQPGQLTLKAWARNAGQHPAVAQSYQADLKKCGINVEIIPVPQGDYYSTYLGQPSKGKAGEWDISAPGWIPDWYGNNGRATIQPLFETNCVPNTVNFGCYSNPEVDRAIESALKAKTEDEAGRLWHEVDRLVMEDAAFVPFKTEKYPIYHSDRVKGAKFILTTTHHDPTNLWISE